MILYPVCSNTSIELGSHLQNPIPLHTMNSLSWATACAAVRWESSSGRIQYYSLMLLTQHMTYWDTVSWTNRMAVMKYVRAGVLIDNSFGLHHHNDINNGEDLVVAARSGLLNQICQRKAAACHSDSRLAGQPAAAHQRWGKGRE